MTKLEEALEELQAMVNDEIIKLTDNEYNCFFVYYNCDSKKFGLTNVFNVEVSDGWNTFTIEGEVHEEGTTLEELGKKLLDWIYFEFEDWKEEEFRKALYNQQEEEKDIYYMQHVR